MAEAGLILLTLLVGGMCAYIPAELPFLLPFVFNPIVFLGCLLLGFWYQRGLRRLAETPGRVRQGFFWLGLLGTWFVLQTHFEYLAQHMFFLNRAQALMLGMIAPFCAGISWPGAVLAAGAPGWVVAAARRLWRPLRPLTHPLAAMAVFLLSADIWLIPDVHFAAMIDPFLYGVMNLSCLAGGVLFWMVVLDPRPQPPCRFSYLTRAGTGFFVMFPQIAIGAYIALTGRDLFSFYELCGRLFPTISSAHDQMLGGIIEWIPSGMMNVAALIITLNALRLAEMQLDATIEAPKGAKIYEAKWTGR
ncbi:cytochrome c oxidase assembly protein [Acidocella facilis]|uniref:cytochrome c oxidase assembly protein n=1 Tax=Acidocella facilis TaxID=525 RepID=UPI001F22AA75|nr:cytochrome c oxidase assembly protein [Acidocella facilis]